MSPKATHLLDWFHLTMKLTVLGQFGKGLVHCEAVLGEAIRDQIERLTWSLWHGQVDKALGKIDDLETSMEPFRETYTRFPQWVKALSQLRTYIVNNRLLIPNYGECDFSHIVANFEAYPDSALPRLSLLSATTPGDGFTHNLAASSPARA